MKKMRSILKKAALVTFTLAIGLAAFPLLGVSAATSDGPAVPPASQTLVQTDHPRLERAWKLEQTRYGREGNLLAKADGFIAKVQTLLDKATQKGWDVSAVQAALNAFSSVIPAAEAAHEPGAAIILAHSGFDANGKVTDAAKALETVKALQQVLKDTRTAMNGTGRALREAIREFRQAHKNGGTTTP
jgi:hypothetical protein